MVKVYSDKHIEEDISFIIEETFNTCLSNREEIYWLITLLRGFMKVPNKNFISSADNLQINRWQFEMVPIIENFTRKWKL